MVFKITFFFVVFSLFLRDVFPAAERRMNVVMSTDSTYLLPTMAAINSIKEANKNCTLSVSIFASDLSIGSRSLLTNLCGNGLIHFAEISSKSELGKLLDKVGQSIATNDRTPNKFIALRFLLPDILHTLDIPFPERNEHFEPFLWMDSDLVVNKCCKQPSLEELYQACLELGQPIIGSDLNLFCGKKTKQLQNALEEDGVGDAFFKTVDGLPGDDISRISGGVVFWDPERLPEVTAPTRKFGGKPGYPARFQRIYSAFASSMFEKNIPPLVPFLDPNNLTEEGAMDGILRAWANCGNEVCFFSTIYNCRPCCLQSEEDVNRVVVVHWDSDPPYTLKPWEVDDSNDVAARLWWTNFGNLVEKNSFASEDFAEDPVFQMWNTTWCSFYKQDLQTLRRQQDTDVDDDFD